MSHRSSAVLLKPRPHVKYLINRSNTQQFLVQLQVDRDHMSHRPSAVLLKIRRHVRHLINRPNTQQLKVQVDCEPPSTK